MAAVLPAQVAVTEPEPEAPASTPGVSSPATVSLSSDFTTHYFFRGILQEDRGFIAQPRLEVSKPLFEGGEGILSSVTLTVGQWNSLHSGPTGSGGGTDAWYESDTYAGLTGTCGDMTIGAAYVTIASPNGRFATVQELNLSAGWNDSSLWSGSVFSGLRPRASVVFELSGQTDAGDHRGIYAEVGISPGLSFGLRPRRGADVADRPKLGLTLPVTLGFSVADYYERQGRDDTFGYLDVGLAFGLPLPLPARLGEWSMTLAVDAMVLGDNTRAFNHGDGFELVGKLGLTWKF